MQFVHNGLSGPERDLWAPERTWQLESKAIRCQIRPVVLMAWLLSGSSPWILEHETSAAVQVPRRQTGWESEKLHPNEGWHGWPQTRLNVLRLVNLFWSSSFAAHPQAQLGLLHKVCGRDQKPKPGHYHDDQHDRFEMDVLPTIGGLGWCSIGLWRVREALEVPCSLPAPLDAWTTESNLGNICEPALVQQFECPVQAQLRLEQAICSARMFCCHASRWRWCWSYTASLAGGLAAPVLGRAIPSGAGHFQGHSDHGVTTNEACLSMLRVWTICCWSRTFASHGRHHARHKIHWGFASKGQDRCLGQCKSETKPMPHSECVDQ